MAALACPLVPPPHESEGDGNERPVRTRWHRFEQRFGLDLRSLALFRLALGGLVVADVLLRAPWLDVFLTDEGTLPLSAWYESIAGGSQRHRWSLHALSGQAAWVVALEVLRGLAGICLLLGRWTRPACLLAWVLVVSVQNRHPALLNAGDTLLRVLLFWGLFLPLGARFSIDSALATDAVPAPDRRNERWFGVPAFAFLVQLTLIYLCTAAMKTDPLWTSEHGAVRAALSLDYLTLPLGHWLLAWPDSLLGLLTVGTLVVEFAVPLLLWVPLAVGVLRTLAVALMISAHVAFAATMDIGLFSWIAAAAWLAVLPGGFWDALFQRLRRDPRRTGLSIVYDGDCGFCWTMARLLRTFLLLPETPLVPSHADPRLAAEVERENSWIVRRHDGTHLYRFAAVVEVLRRSPWAFPLAPLAAWAPFRKSGEWLYRYVAGHRVGATRWIGWMKAAPRALRPTRFVWRRDVVVLACLAFVVVWNGRVFHNRRTFAPEGTLGQAAAWCADVIDGEIVAGRRSGGLAWFGEATRLAQAWNMFAPKPTSKRGWFVVRGERAGLPPVDLWRALVLEEGQHEPVATRPANVHALYPDARWRKYMMNLEGSMRRPHAALFTRWLVRRWDELHPTEAPFDHVRLIFHAETVQRDGSIVSRGPRSVWAFAPTPRVARPGERRPAGETPQPARERSDAEPTDDDGAEGD